MAAFWDVGQCLAAGPLIHLGGFILQAQCPQPVGNEILNFQVVGRGGPETSLALFFSSRARSPKGLSSVGVPPVRGDQIDLVGPDVAC